MSRIRTSAVGVVLAMTTMLTACAQPALEPQPVAPDGPVPVVVPDQLNRVVEQVSEAVAAGDASNDVNQLTPRVDGPALQLRQAQYAIRAAVPTQPAPTVVAADTLVDVVPHDQPWPRSVLTVARPAPDAVPQVQLLTQASARVPYKLTATAKVLPGVTLPRTEPPETGVEALPATEQSELAATPADAVAMYADVLTNGAASQHAAAFAEDPFRATVVGEQDAERTAAGTTCPGCFSYSVTHAPRADAVWSLRTEDGGAMVVAAIDTTRTFTVAAAGAKLPISADLAVLAGKAEATQSAAITSVEVVVLHVPAEGSEDKITVLAAERGPLSVTAT